MVSAPEPNPQGRPGGTVHPPSIDPLSAPSVHVPDLLPAEAQLSVPQAAEVTGQHEATIYRHARKGVYANATKDTLGAWWIPVTDLVAAGELDPTRVDDAAPHVAAREAVARVHDLEDEVRELNRQKWELEIRLEDKVREIDLITASKDREIDLLTKSNQDLSVALTALSSRPGLRSAS
jgi:hypothetical protein